MTRLRHRKAFRGNVVLKSYDPFGNVTAPSMNYDLQLDAYGNATNVQDVAGNEWRYMYDFDSALVGEEFIGAGGSQSLADAVTNSLGRSFDAFNRPSGYVLSINGSSKGGVGYAYDENARLSGIAATNAAGRIFFVAYTNAAGFNYGYTITTPGGDMIRRVVERDPFRRNLVTNCVTVFNSTSVDSNAYSFDALSRPVERVASRTGCQPVHSAFSYNERSEVLSAAIGTNLFVHAYDAIGNHTLHAANGVTNAYEHNSLNQYAAAFDPAEPAATWYEPEYTVDGGMATDWEWDFEYDAADRLSSVAPTFPEDASLRVLNEYDYRGRRIRKIVQRLTIAPTPPPPSPPIEMHTWNTIETRTFVYDDWNLIHETACMIDGATTNTTETQYFWGLDLSDTLHGAGGVGGLLALSSNGLFYFPTFDNNGNVTKYIDESGNVVAAYEYDDFGKLISQTGPLADFFRIRFSTKYFDPETALYYYGKRYYAPYWRLWLNRDPIAESGGLNIYSFCGNHPIVENDLLGLKVRSAVTPSKCSDKDIDAEARKVLVNAVILTQRGSPRLEHYGNLCCTCRKGKYEVIVTGPIPGKIVVSYSQYKGRSYKQEIPASFPDDPRIRCPQGTQRVGYYHTHIDGPSFSETDLDTLEARDHRYYVSQDGKRIEKAIPRRVYDSMPNVYVPGGIPIRPVVVILKGG